MNNFSNAHDITADVRQNDEIMLLNDGDIAAVSGGTQLYSHQFSYIKYQLDGLRPFEPSFAEAVNDANYPVTK